MQDTQTETLLATKTDEFGITTTVRVQPTHSGLFKVLVMHKFPSGNYAGETFDNQSEVGAMGMMHFYTGK